MSNPRKLQTIEQLAAHIEAHRAEKGISSGFGTFRDMMEARASTLSMKKTFHCNYKTMQKWIEIYNEAQLAGKK